MEAVDEALRLLEPALRRAAGQLVEPPLRQSVDYQMGWSGSEAAAAVGTPGRRTRALVAMFAAEAVNGSLSDALPAAVAVEFVHTFSIIHDDVMDGDELRRGRPALWKMIGVPSAILVGDALLVAAFRALAGAHAAGQPSLLMLQDTVTRMTSGQWADLNFERRTDVTWPEYVAMASGKTGELFAYAGAAGALFGGASEVTAARLRRFGRRIGLAVQVIDDLVAIWDDGRGGKPVHADIRRRKRTAPVVAALARQGEASRQLAEVYGRQPSGDDAEDRRVATLIEAAGGRAWAESFVMDCLRYAKSELEGGLLREERLIAFCRHELMSRMPSVSGAMS